MNLVDQIFEQAKLGTAVDPSANPFATGVQLGQHQQSLNLQKQQLAMEIAQAPLKQTLLQQDAQLNELKLTDLLQNRQDTVSNEAAFQGLAAKVGEQMRDDPVAAEATIWEAIGKTKGLYRHPGIKPLLEDTRAGIGAKLELQKLKSQDFTGPELKTITDAGGNPITFAREGPNSWKPIQDNTIEVKTPEGTIVRQSTGSGGGRAANFGLQPAVTADVEKKLAANDQSLSLLDQSIGLITPTTVGPVGAATEQLEKLANIAKPGSMDPAATRARQTFRITAQQQYNALKADSQINKVEAAALESIANITSLNESDPTAREKYNTLRDLTALRSVLFNHQLGKFAPDTALKAMSLDQLARAWKRKDITDAEVERWNEIHQLVK